ncbi:MAG: WD40 repeat domain-containing protein [Planctomycetia bacterium]|nr:WD40 repeat domain-containing protein [Planctomycetia bacterium]
MSDDFNPYYEWLAIPLEDQPANFYRLLGVKDFESNPKIIQNAADRQMAHIRTFQQGKYAAESQKLLNELAKARVILLDTARREAYDQALGLAGQVSRPAAVPVSASDSFPLDLPIQVGANTARKKKSLPPWLSSFWVLGGGAAAVLILLLLVLRGGEKETGITNGQISAQNSTRSSLKLDEMEGDETEEAETDTSSLSGSEESSSDRSEEEVEEVEEVSKPAETLEESDESTEDEPEEESVPVVTPATKGVPKGKVSLAAVAGKGGFIDILDIDSRKRIGRLESGQDFIRGLAFSPDGKKLVSGATDGTIRVWDVKRRESLGCWEGHQGWVNSLVFTPNGEKVISVSEDKTIRIWDVATGAMEVTFTQRTPIRAVTISPDGKRFYAANSMGYVAVYDLPKKEKNYDFQANSGPISSLKMTSEGSLISSDWNGSIQVWNLTNNEVTGFFPHVRGVSETVLSPDEKWLATGSDDRRTRVYDFVSGECLHTLPYNSRGLAFTLDGKYLLGGRDDRKIRFWNLETGEVEGEYDYPGEEIFIIATVPQAIDRSEEGGTEGEQETTDVATEQLEGTGAQPRKMEDLMNAPLSPEEKKRLDLLGAARDKAYLMAVGGYTGDISVWNMGTRRVIQYFKGHDGYIEDLCFSPDGKKLASCGTDRTLRVWDVKSGRELDCWKEHSDRINSVEFSPDGKQLLTGGEDKVMRLWEVRTGRILGVFPQQRPIRDALFSPNGKLLLAGDNGGYVVIYDAQTGKRVRNFKANPGGIASMAVMDNRTLLTCGWDGTFHSWDFVTGKLRGNIAHPKGVARVTLSADGKWMATSCEDHVVRIFNVATGKLYNSIPHHCTGLALTADGKFVLGGRYDYTVKMWESETGKLEHEFNYRGSPINKVALTTTEVNLSGESAREEPVDEENLATIPEKERILSLSMDHSMKLWEEKNGTLLESTLAAEELYAIAYDEPRHRVVIAGKDPIIRMLDLKTMEIQKAFRGHENAVFAVAVSPNGERLASGGADGSLYIWDTQDPEEPLAMLKGHKNGVNALVFYSDTILISAGADKVIRAWNLKTEKSVRMMTGHTDVVLALALSPDKKLLLSGGLDDSIRLWNPKTGKQLKKLTGHTDEVSTLAFSPDGKIFVSGSWDNTIKIWDTEKREEKGTLEEHSEPLFCVRFTPDGKRILSGGMDKTIYLWDVESQKMIRAFHGHDACVSSLMVYEE